VDEQGVKYALMATHMDPNAKTLEKMENILKTKSITKIPQGLKIKVEGMKGPLEEGYEKKIEAFASQILNHK
jgi:hypothetical protein